MADNEKEPEGHFKNVWPRSGCDCSESLQGRTSLIEKTMGLGELVLAEMQRLQICPTMYPHALGMASAFALGYLEQSLSPATRGMSLLQFPEALKKLEIVEMSARSIMLAAQEGSSARN